MLSFLSIFSKKKDIAKNHEVKPASPIPKKTNDQIATRKGELGEYKINIQLAQLPKDFLYLSDIMIKNQKSQSGYSQIDHLIITPYGIFVIETKNYQGTIYGSKEHKSWLINGKFKMMNPFVQNYGHIQALKSLIDVKYHSLFISMVSFTKRCTFKLDLDYRKIDSNELIVYDLELTDFIHRKISRIKMAHQDPLLSDKEIIFLHNCFKNLNVTNPKIREQHIHLLKSNPSDSKSKKSTCVICNTSVSEKVKMYCLSNTKFKGKIYCFDHQKSIEKSN
ncbi:hypothetical protein BACCIP111895_03094 [Neobacillus rhizosphaerae]|uniref:NERD domain-containing protein n=1 Tax=Neobacillus rhizosphaerae TaxID=2880965 RepID=A0ABM9ETD5_9BACI|nr:nuclease-related domain-containing protein [Neobacillus rhizosphaerae]CAH2715910.1 hypothetical protein BACCIP111895_03094 [Neobacillus rhizosphaerae]